MHQSNTSFNQWSGNMSQEKQKTLNKKSHRFKQMRYLLLIKHSKMLDINRIRSLLKPLHLLKTLTLLHQVRTNTLHQLKILPQLIIPHLVKILLPLKEARQAMIITIKQLRLISRIIKLLEIKITRDSLIQQQITLMLSKILIEQILLL